MPTDTPQSLSNGVLPRTNGKIENIVEGDLLRKVHQLVLKENIVTGTMKSTKVIEFLQPKELENVLNLGIGEEGTTSHDEIDEILEKVVKYSVKTTHPHFFNQLYGGIDEVALSAAWLTEALHTNQHTYEVAPVFMLIERYLVSTLVKSIGWSEGDGIFSPGGSMANMYSVAVARHKKFPELKKAGHFGRKPLAIITSDMSHYSFVKAAAWMGFGTDQVYSVKSNDRGKITGPALKETIAQIRRDGKEPFFVNATAGTTVYGAFDPVEEIADVCEEEDLWLHVDSCWGGGAMFSEEHKSLMKGVDRADSVAWNAHKMFCAPLQCSIFLLKYKNLLQECNGQGATYLFQTDKMYDVSYDSGDKSIQCGRKTDGLKLWMLLKINGLREMRARVDNAFKMARYLEDLLRTRSNFRLVLDKHDCTNVCFWYIPPSMQGQEENEEWHQKLHKVTAAIKTRMVLAGTLLIGYTPLPSKNLVNFFRMIVTCYPRPTEQDMEFLVDEIEKLGKDL